MSDTSPASASRAARSRTSRRPRRWRQGGSAVSGWDLGLFGTVVFLLGVGTIAARVAETTLPAEAAGPAAQAVTWSCFAVPVLFAFRRSRPRGLLRFRAVDLAYGVVFGVMLRGVQGAIAGLGGTPPPWPSTFSSGGGLPPSFPAEAIAGIVVSPALEEMLFRGVILVCAFAATRRVAGTVAAGIAAVALSTVLFVVAHLLVGTPDAVDLSTLALVGVVTGIFVVATGRLWPALVIHAVFNATGFAMIALGTLLA